MNHLMLICSDGISTDAKAATMSETLRPYVEEIQAGGQLLYGHRLAGADHARTVRVRGGQTLVSDGPFTESKEFVAGFDLLDCADLAEAVTLASHHPVSWFHSVEVRAIAGCREGMVPEPPADRLFEGPPEGTQRCAVFICVDGVPLSDAEEEAISDASINWGARLRAEGICPFGTPLVPAAQARTVRVRAGETLVSDGPFVESKEYLAGLVVLDVADVDTAIQLAAEHPIAAHHRLEVRPFHVE